MASLLDLGQGPEGCPLSRQKLDRTARCIAVTDAKVEDVYHDVTERRSWLRPDRPLQGAILPIGTVEPVSRDGRFAA
ncbi:hypothetical protein E3U26_20885 (plasmid) [Paracoccus ferrooxidans]|nr:hypothetical protein E3U26_20885 [Paracoccus ferrooxidans]